MRKVDNKKVIHRLSDRSFRSGKTRNIIAILAIALTGMLFTALFTVGIGLADNIQKQTMRSAGGDWHGVFKNLTREQYETLKKDPSIKECADNMLVAYEVENPEFLKRHIEMWYYPAPSYSHYFVDIIDGKTPEKADEILIDEKSLELMGKEPKAGQQITLDLKIRINDKETVKRTFTVSGVTKADPLMNVGFVIVPKAYLEEYAQELAYTCDKDFDPVGAIRMDVNFANSLSVTEKLEKAVKNAGYSTEAGNENSIEYNANWAYMASNTEGDLGAVAAVAAGILLIGFTGYLIIYNIFQISVVRDIRYYGLLKTIGTTGKQIKKIIRRQAFFLGIIGIPAGMILGYFTGKAIIPLIFVISESDVSSVDTAVFHPLIFVGAAVFSTITIWISTGKPARTAAKVSAVEAVRYTEGGGDKKKQKKSSDGGKIWKMAFSNVGRNRKKYILVVVSLSLSVVLLNSVFTLTQSFDLDTYLKKFVSYDFQIANAQYMNCEYRGTESTIEEESLTESFITACENLEGYEEGGRIYGTLEAGVSKDCVEIPDSVPRNEDGEPGNYFGKIFQSFSRNETTYDTIFYGLDDFFYDKVDVWKGEKDPEVIREKLKSGKYVLLSVDTDDNGKVEEESCFQKPGDKIVIEYGEGQKREFEILSIIKENYYGLSSRVGHTFSYYASSDVFKEMFSDKYLMTYGFNAADEKEEAVNEFLKNYTETQEPVMAYESKMGYEDEFDQMLGMVIIVGGILTFVVGIIGVLNFINSILTGIVTRKREFAMMEAIGMTKKQLSRMLMLEGVYYAVGTIFCSFVLGCLFSVTVIRALAGGMWFMKYHFIITPMLLIFPVLLILGAVVPKVAFCFGKKESVVERIRETE